MAKSLGQVAYERYADHRKWVAFNGKPIPEWSKVLMAVREAWEVAAYFTVRAWMRDDFNDHATYAEWYSMMEKIAWDRYPEDQIKRDDLRVPGDAL